MNPKHSPLHILENFSLLEALQPGRIDLGMGRAAGTDGLTNAVLRNSNEQLTGDQIMNQLMEILAFFDRDFPEDQPCKDIKASPDKNLRPELLLLGSSDGGMAIASRLGIGLAFAGQLKR